MIALEKYYHLSGNTVRLLLADGNTLTGFFSDVVSAEDNAEHAIDNGREPPGASIYLDTTEGIPMEIYASEIERMEATQ